MPTEKELIAERLKKREEILKSGIDPYPYRYVPTHHAKEILQKYAEIKAETKTSVRVAGRITGLRRMGKLTFMHILDQTGAVQALFAFDQLGEKKYDFLKLLDRGDWVGVEGPVFKTKTGEVTIRVTGYELLCKSLRPLPEKWHGLKDIELRYRKRYVDLIMNPQVREVFIKRTKIVDAIRELLNKRGFLEVETPILQPVYGGARAKPFKTHLNALDMDVYLRISNELYLKRLIVGGFERVYEFSKDFRNEDIDRTHNPEFTQIEIYQAFADFNDMKELVEDIFVASAKAIYGSTKFEYQGHEIDVKKPWKSYKMSDALKELGNVDVSKLTDKELKALCLKHKIPPEKTINRGLMEEALFNKLVEEQLIQPTFITHHPYQTTPLCKPCREPHLKGTYIERFEPFIAGMEVANAYSELNDPVLQRKLLEEQAKALKAGELEAHPMDEDFIEAIEYGMPPTGGVGVGIDRLAMLLTNSPSISDVIIFPFMKI